MRYMHQEKDAKLEARRDITEELLHVAVVDIGRLSNLGWVVEGQK